MASDILMASHPQSRGRGPSFGSRSTIVRAILFSIWALAAASGFAVEARAGTKLLRFPDLHGDKVVFMYAGDLWTCSAGGGSATRLTAHPGLELFPKFSPDGRWIAFTGQYDGDEQVYVIPSGGGEPRQLTFYPARGPLPARWGYDNQVTGWTPDGKGIVFRSYRDSWALPITRLYVAPAAGGPAKALAMPTSGAGDFSPEGDKIAYSPLSRDFRSWKRYQGGWAQQLYAFDLKSQDLEPIAHSPRTERDPMWIKDAIVFASDRDDTLNLYHFDIATKAGKPLTHETTWDVRWPSKAEDSRIVFELAGELKIINADTGETKAIEITVPDDGLAKRPSRVSAANAIDTFSLSPKGERAAVAARGDVFTVPAEKGDTRNLTRSSNAHDRLARWSPDGKTIAFVSDRSGEEEIYLVAQDGKSAPSALTRDSKAMIFTLDWAPDGKRLSYSDKNGKLRVVEIADKSVVEAADDKTGSISDSTWSPDSRFLAFSLSHENGNSVLAI